MKINNKNLPEILKDHGLWLSGEGGERAILRFADLRGADLSFVNLQSAIIRSADMRNANLSNSNFSNADMSNVDMSNANMRNSNLRQANISYSNFSGSIMDFADLTDANIQGAYGNSVELKSIFVNDSYPITYTARDLQIACKRYRIEDWWGFSDKDIRKMDGGGRVVSLWGEWRDTIKMIIEKSPAVQKMF